MGNKVLVVDDAKELVELIQERLESNGYVVITACNGVEGLEKAKNENPDLIISDIVMPEMDGYELYKALKKDQNTSHIPIVVLTVREKMEETFKAMGAADFVAKPFDPHNLVDRVKLNLERISSEPKEETPPASVEDSPPAGPEPQTEAPPKQEEAEPQIEEPPAVEEKEPEKASEPPPEKKSEPSSPSAEEKEAPPKEQAEDTSLANVLVCGCESITTKMKKILKKSKCRVEAIDNVADLVVKATEINPEVVIIDVIMNNKSVRNNVASLRKVRELRTLPIIVYSFLDKDNLGNVSVPQRKMEIDQAKTACLDVKATAYIGEFEESSFLSNVNEFLPSAQK